MKTKSKPTPVQPTAGDWSIIADNQIHKEHRYSVASVVPGRGVISIASIYAQAWKKGQVKNDPEGLRNAQLISAAPSLLQAAEKFWAFYTDLAASNPGFLSKLALQDYLRFAEAVVELPLAIERAHGKTPLKKKTQ